MIKNNPNISSVFGYKVGRKQNKRLIYGKIVQM